MLYDDLIKNMAIQGDFAVTPIVHSVGSGVMCPKAEHIADFTLPNEKAQSCESSMIQFGGTFC